MAAIGNSPTQQAFTPAIDYFSGNGSTTAFTLSRPVASVAQVQVTIDNVAQNPSSAYTVSANTITFTSAPLSGTNNIYVYYTSPITQVIAPGQGTVTATSMASSTGTGAGVFQTSPTLVTPVLGVASATSITVAAGAVGTPSITTAGDTNTGIFFPAADTIAFSEGGAESMRIDASGNVGIGMTASANPKLQIKQFNNTTDGGLLITSADASGSAGLARLNDGGMTFRNAGAETMRIVSSGELVVGGTTAGGVGTSIAAPDSGGIYCNTATTGLRNQIRFVNPNGTVGSIQTNGSATAYNTSSDYRLKENITPMTGALDKVALLKPVTYKWKVDGSDGEGFIAHELAEVKPDCVSGDKDAVDADGNPEYQGIDVSFLVATLTAAIQELKAINDTQAETINALTARIVALENR
jgi:hypothetical protein